MGLYFCPLTLSLSHQGREGFRALGLFNLPLPWWDKGTLEA
jgi:hypothetical protein